MVKPEAATAVVGLANFKFTLEYLGFGEKIMLKLCLSCSG